MAKKAKKKDDADQVPLPAPVLLSPREEHAVSGEDVTFEWEPVEGAQEYRLQVAADTEFETLVLDQSVGTETSLDTSEDFPEDRHTFYWRVLVRGEAGWSGADRIESFLSVTPEQADALLDRPEEEEDLGPGAELFKAAGVEAAAEAGADEDLKEEELAYGVEGEGVEAGQILGFVGVVVVALILIIVVIFLWTGFTQQRVEEIVVSRSEYPELQETEITAAEQLSQYDVLIEEEGVYRIPIERSISLIANEARQEQRSYSSELAPLLLD